jgi:hypothetical protein
LIQIKGANQLKITLKVLNQKIIFMFRRSILIVSLMVTLLFLGVSKLAISATDTDQQDIVEGSPSEKDCRISGDARKASDQATSYWMQVGLAEEALDLIIQAEAVSKPPECDSVRAKILAVKAIEILIEVAAQEGRSLDADFEGPKSKKVKKVKYKYKPDAMFPDCKPPGLLVDFGDGGDLALVTISLPSLVATTTGANMFYTASKISGIDGCEKIAAIKFQQHRFTAIARDNLVKDMARGAGEYVTALAYLQGCSIEIHNRYAEMTRLNFHQIVPSSQTEPKTILSNLDIEIMRDPLLAKECKWVL